LADDFPQPGKMEVEITKGLVGIAAGPFSVSKRFRNVNEINELEIKLNL